MVLAAIAAAVALHWLRPVMVPFVLALFIALALDMLVEGAIARLRLPRALAMAVVLGVAVLFFVFVGVVVSAAVRQIGHNAPQYSEQLTQLVERGLAALPPSLRGFGVRSELETLSEIPVGYVGSLLAMTTNAVLNLLSNSLLVLVFVLFLVLGSRPGRAPGTWGRIQLQVQRYLVWKVVISALTGILVGSVLTAIGIPLAMAFGLMAFLLNFIPSIGSVVATLLPVPVVIVSPEISPLQSVLAVAVPGTIQLTLGNFVEPKLLGESLDLHPAMILISLIFWGMLWGVVGALLATPITAVLKILLDKFEGSRPVAELMAGRLAYALPPGPEPPAPEETP